MVVDNFPAHPAVELTNIELVFLPPNTTSHTQLMDSGIIKNLKHYYRKSLALRRLEASDEDTPFSWNILDAVIALKSAWARVTPQTITNCYMKAGCVLVNQTDEANPDSVPNEPAENEPEDTDEFRNIWTRLREVYGDCVPRAVDDYTSVDDLAQTSAELNDDDIVQVFRDPSLEGNLGDEDDDDQMELEAPAPKLAEAYSALRTLRC